MGIKTSTIYRAIGRINRNLIINRYNRNKIKNDDFSIISNNCTGALITHDLGKQFLSPTVNLFMHTEDFVKFVTNLDYYLSQEIEEVETNTFNYPVGKLSDLKIHFMHYASIEEAIKKWNDRKKRINFDNLFIMMTENDECSDELIRKYDSLPYKHKVLLTNKEREGINSAILVEGFENEKVVGDLSLYKNIFGQKLYDCFDYVDWLNQNK